MSLNKHQAQIVADFRSNLRSGMSVSGAAAHATHECNEFMQELIDSGIPYTGPNEALCWWNTEADWSEYK